MHIKYDVYTSNVIDVNEMLYMKCMYVKYHVCVVYEMHVREISWMYMKCMYVKYHVCVFNVKYRVAKTHRIPYLYRSFSAKEPYI